MFSDGAQRATATVTAQVLGCGVPEQPSEPDEPNDPPGPGGLCVLNPSFEGTPGLGDLGLMLPEWTLCELTPDVNPGTGLSSLPASDGRTYLGLGAGLGVMESVSGRFCAALQPGVPVAFQVDIGADQEPFGSVQLWGATRECGKDELLWSGRVTQGLAWQTACGTFTPSRAFTHLLVTADLGYLVVDNLRGVARCEP